MQLWIILIILLIALSISIILSPPPRKEINKSNTCSKDTCGAIDDVNNPAYNMKEVIKNTLLIEDHLANKSKYCKQCIVKHFLLSEAYLSEAIWMSCDKCKDYPMLEESITFYKITFEEWYKKMDDDDTRLLTLTKLREWRQKAVQFYYFAEGER
jgi:hypothetical protein